MATKLSATAARLATILSQTASLTFTEGQSRDAVIANARAYLGKTPSKEGLDTWKEQAIIGRMAFKLPYRKGETQEARIAKAADLKRNYADPVKEGAKAKKLRQGLKGRRTVEQHKVQRAAIEHANLLLRDAYPEASGRKDGQQEKNANAAKRKARASTANAKPEAPTHGQLVQGKPSGKFATATDLLQYLNGQSLALATVAKRNAGICPADAGAAVEAFRTAILSAANALQERLAAEMAKAA